jgi:dTDP-4-dehydrorhamnose 3,5-epimerase
MVNELYFSDFNRGLVSVPQGIYHAVENVGTDEGLIVSVPSVPYQHDDPDKWLLPLENDLIPYSFRSVLKGF